MISQELLNQIRNLDQEVTGLRNGASAHLSKRDSIHVQLAGAGGYRFALLSRHFPNPKGPCPLTTELEGRLRKEYREANEKYKKALVTLGKRDRNLQRKINQLTRSHMDLVNYMTDQKDKIMEADALANGWAEACRSTEEKYNPIEKAFTGLMYLIFLPLVIVDWIGKELSRN